MRKAPWTQLGLAIAATALPAGRALPLIAASWDSTPAGVPGYVQNDLEVQTTQDWLSTQLLVELNSGQFHYVTEGVVPSLDPTLLVGKAANTSLTYPAGGNPSDPLNSQIPGFAGLFNAGTGGSGGLGGSIPAVVDLDTFDLTYFGPPTETDDIAFVTPLELARMTVSDDGFGTWAVRLRNNNPIDPENQPGETLVLTGYVFNGAFFEGNPLPGDTDNDGDVDDADLGTAFANYTGPIGAAGGKNLGDGDTDGDGDVDDADLGSAFANYTGPLGPAAAVPEPGAGLLVLTCTGLFLARRRRTAV